MVQARIEGEALRKLEDGLKDAVASDNTYRLMDRIGARMVSSTQKRIQRGDVTPNAPLTKAIKSGDKPLRDSGALLNSLNHRPDSNSVAWGSPLHYARLQQEGGVIRPRRARKLWIPAGAETRQFMRRYGGTVGTCIRGMRNDGYRLWVQKNVMLAKKGKRGKTRVLFILKDEVKIPARPVLQVDENDRRTIVSLARRHIQEGFS